MIYGTKTLRATLKAYHRAHDEAYLEWERRGRRGNPIFPAFPPECRGMACAANTRNSTPCKNTAIYSNGRCKFHGGLSTGPKTDAGKQRVALNGKINKKHA